MPRYKLTIEYVGTRYSGWQAQRNARTVAGELLAAVKVATGGDALELMGSGRTDAGVHAVAQIAHLDLPGSHDPRELRHALNDALPADIHVLGIASVDHRFHARHGANARQYLYQVSRRRTAFAKPFVWWVKDPLDAERLAAAARVFEGRHDYRSFCDRDPALGSTLVHVERCRAETHGPLLLIRVRASHFLWRQVRRMVGVLVEVGRGTFTPEDVAAFLRSDSREPARFTAPPSGLFLERVDYEGEASDPDAPLRPAVPLRTPR